MKVHQAMAMALSELGVDTIFGLVGDSNMFLADSYVKLGHRYVPATNENSALMMAAGDRAVTGRVGVATVTQLAISVAIPALLEGVRGRTPLVVISGDTPVIDKNGLQNIDQPTLVRSTGAGYELIRSAATVVDDMRTAIRRAISERCPIVLSGSTDLQWQEIDYRTPFPIGSPVAGGPASRAAVEEAVGVIASATRPLLLAGVGANSRNGRAALIRLAERLGHLSRRRCKRKTYSVVRHSMWVSVEPYRHRLR